MNLEQVREVLVERFNQSLSQGQQRQIIFWYDTEGDFSEEIDRLELPNAKLWKLTGDNNFATKYQLEVEDRDSNYLIYSSNSRPVPQENWLLDIVEYGEDFIADKITIIMKDFGVEDRSLRPVFKRYKKFFNNQRRYNRLQRYNIEDYDERKLDMAIVSALAGLRAPSLEKAIRKILMDSLFNNDNKYLERINKFGDQDKFWELIADKYGYISEDRDLEELMILFIVSNLEHNLATSLPQKWQSYLSFKENNCIVFLDQWMNHTKDSQDYDEIAIEIERRLNLTGYLGDWELEYYLECETLKGFDRAIINQIADNLLSGVEDFTRYQKIISLRRTKHWYQEFKEIYEALYWAVELFKLAKEKNKLITQEKADKFFNKYVEEYHQFDKAYRKFYFAYDKANDKELLKELRTEVENLYTNWYLHELSIKWSNSIEEISDSWELSGVSQQQDFYQEFIAETVQDKGERVFVIISDALRYEAAAEFRAQINNQLKGSTDLFAMQGSLPSTTKLGMVSLLPNKEITIKDNGDIFVDGISSKGLENRKKILANNVAESIALRYQDIVDMSRSELREEVKGTKLVYIYHNEIDAKGDNPATEQETFRAVERTFKQLDELVRTFKYALSAVHIYITADHGFIYRRSDLEASDKTARVKDNIFASKRRVLLSGEEVDLEGTLSINLDYIFGEDNSLNAIVPRGVNRFKKQGAGQNYVHGGASLQEVVIPVIKFRNDRSENSENEVDKVEVKLTSITRKITNNVFFLEFFQAEKIVEKRVARRLYLYFEDESGAKISNENIIIADSTSDKPEERTFKEKFTLRNRDYRRDKDYYLVIIDEETEEVYEEIKFEIDLL
ncbi:BREX-1 system phosphatase PglZ type A [Natroniella acetigena]|uniref:BREX-1 system phosphatase PglZ type A n=1 Tax=Natroniella acetigena TaxID=52004 RepID=UPI00200AAEBD|nr:BREX-1 system phosphatase PglZ type A [Natroniella acetigena]MCK8827427.1 BREX-1 system phosphatase PglZ type A [Natroniella acetigena]